MKKKCTHLLFTGQQSRVLDQCSGFSGWVLMQKAGTFVFEKLIERYPEIRARKVSLSVFCGAGNNAGDGYVVASLAQRSGIKTNVYAMKTPDALQREARYAWDMFVQHGGCVTLYDPEKVPCIEENTIIVDALLGTGIKGALSPAYQHVIHFLNTLPQSVVSIDIPSGLCPDTGMVVEHTAVKAEITVVLVCLKRGLFTGSSRDYCGKIYFAPLGIPTAVFDTVIASAELMQLNRLPAWIKKRKYTAHKGCFGKVLVIGGELGMGGAVALAAEAALAVGTGSVTVYTRVEHISGVLARCPEAMVYGCDTHRLEDLMVGKTALIVGPGLGRTAWSTLVMEHVCNANIPVLLDADALNWLAAHPKKQYHVEGERLFTPHPGEAARLLSCTIQTIEKDRFQAVDDLWNKWGGTIVLKGAGTLVSGETGRYVCGAGNALLATAGSGDILSGIAGGLLAQGYDSESAAYMGVLLHAIAADTMAQEEGHVGVRASELIPYVRRMWSAIHEKIRIEEHT